MRVLGVDFAPETLALARRGTQYLLWRRLGAFRTGDADALRHAGAASVLQPYNDSAEFAVRRLLAEIDSP